MTWNRNFMRAAALVVVAGMCGTARADLILTGIIDGPLSGGLPKAIELYATVDIPDLSIYGVELVSNANSTTNQVKTAFSDDSLSAGEFYYVAANSTGFSDFFGFSPDLTTGQLNHNGDDDFYIYKNGEVIDVWGGSDGLINTNTDYNIVDSWAYRVDETSYAESFDTAQWVINPKNSLKNKSTAADAGVTFGSYQAAAVPEPSSIALAGLGVAGALAMGIRRRGA